MSQRRKKNTSKHYVPELYFCEPWQSWTCHSKSELLRVNWQNLLGFFYHTSCQLIFMASCSEGHRHRNKKKQLPSKGFVLQQALTCQLACYHQHQRHAEIHRCPLCKPEQAAADKKLRESLCLLNFYFFLLVSIN